MCARLSLPDAKPRVASSGHRNACTLHAVEALDQSARRSYLTTCLGEQQALTRLRTELAAPRAQAAARQAARPATPVVGGEEQGGAAGAARMRLAAARALGRLGARLPPGARPRAPPSSCRAPGERQGALLGPEGLVARAAERGLAKLGACTARPARGCAGRARAAPRLTPRRACPPAAEALPAALLAALAGASATGRLLAGLAVAEWAHAAKAAAAEPVPAAVVQAVHAASAVPGAPSWQHRGTAP